MSIGVAVMHVRAARVHEEDFVAEQARAIMVFLGTLLLLPGLIERWLRSDVCSCVDLACDCQQVHLAVIRGLQGMRWA